MRALRHLGQLLPRLIVATVVVVALGAGAAAAAAAEELGLELVPGSKKLGTGRYASQRDFDGTVKFFRDRWKNNKAAVKWFREVSLPAVKYVHLESAVDSTPWQGVNIYQVKGQDVRFTILPRPPKAPASSTSPAPPLSPKP